ncbi:hypothetical protein [Sphaerospermopsis sp. FACHB-1094]|nr:hypothetical protein [Sphaerospermopsis sp. FACHB-1094]
MINRPSPQSPVPNHQSPITSPQSPVPNHQSPQLLTNLSKERELT